MVQVEIRRCPATAPGERILVLASPLIADPNLSAKGGGNRLSTSIRGLGPFSIRLTHRLLLGTAGRGVLLIPVVRSRAPGVSFRACPPLLRPGLLPERVDLLKAKFQEPAQHGMRIPAAQAMGRQRADRSRPSGNRSRRNVIGRRVLGIHTQTLSQ